MPVWREDHGPSVQIEEVGGEGVLTSQFYEDLVIWSGRHSSRSGRPSRVRPSRTPNRSRTQALDHDIGMVVLVQLSGLGRDARTEQRQSEHARREPAHVRTRHAGLPRVACPLVRPVPASGREVSLGGEITMGTVGDGGQDGSAAVAGSSDWSARVGASNPDHRPCRPGPGQRGREMMLGLPRTPIGQRQPQPSANPQRHHSSHGETLLAGAPPRTGPAASCVASDPHVGSITYFKVILR